MLLWVCTVTVIDYRRCQNAVRTSLTHLAAPCVLIVLFLPHFGITYDLLLNRCTTCGVCLLKSGHMYLKGRHIHTLCLQIQLLRFCKLCVLHCHLFLERKQETEFSNPLHLEIQDCKKSMNHQFFNNQEMIIQFLSQNQVICKMNPKSVIHKIKNCSLQNRNLFHFVSQITVSPVRPLMSFP